jgi:hypothetical protein
MEYLLVILLIVIIIITPSDTGRYTIPLMAKLLVIRLLKVTIRIEFLRKFINRFSHMGFEAKLNLGISDFRPYYAHICLNAVKQAKCMGLSGISIIEFGVAGGRGLLQLEEISAQLEHEFGIQIDVYGFDSAIGLPKPLDYRDLPYLWSEALYKMNVDVLSSRLKKSKLFLGSIENTLPTFCEEINNPIAAIVFDLDFYSSTKSALEVFLVDSSKKLARIMCYFDDIFGDERTMFNEFSGVRLAVREFNEEQTLIKVCPINTWSCFEKPWMNAVYVAHSFDHPHYTMSIDFSHDSLNL